MDDIKNYNPAEAETLDSREVAEMVSRAGRRFLPGSRQERRKMQKRRRTRLRTTR